MIFLTDLSMALLSIIHAGYQNMIKDNFFVFILLIFLIFSRCSDNKYKNPGFTGEAGDTALDNSKYLINGSTINFISGQLTPPDY